MADYRLSAQMISRAHGRSAVAAAAYRAGETLSDERTGLEHDYSRKGGVLHSEIMAAEGAPAWALERETLWNAVEKSETRSNSQVAREIQLSLPHELNAEQRLALVREFVQENFVARGMVADVALHAPPRDGDQRNFHAHVMLTTREIGADGFARTKQRDWNSQATLEGWREAWAATQNRHLRQVLGAQAPQVSHRSYAEQGIERVPTQHLGPAATAMERCREPSRRGDVQREARSLNDRLKAARARQDTLAARSGPGVEKGLGQISAEMATLRERLSRDRGEHAKALADALAQMKGKRRFSVGSIEKMALDPFVKEERQAMRELDQARQRAGIDASPKTIMRWFTNPAGMLWHSAKRSMEVDRAAAKLDRAQKNRERAVTWLRSPAGMDYTAGKVRELQGDLGSLRTAERRARRNLAQTDRRLRTATSIERMAKGLADAELGKGIVVPSQALDTTRYLKAVQGGLQDMVRKLTPQQTQTLKQVLSLGIGIGRGR